MNKLLLCFHLFFATILGFGQIQIEHLYRPTGAVNELNLLELSESTFLFGITYTTNTFNVTGYSTLDQYGNVTNSKSFFVDTNLVIRSIKKYQDNELVFLTSYLKDSCNYPGFGLIPNRYPVLGRMDTLGNILESKYFVLGGRCLNSAGDFEVLSNASFVIWGISPSLFLGRVDSALNIIWTANFDQTGEIAFAKELPNQGMIVGMNLDSAGVVVSRIDAQGNFIWKNRYFNNGSVRDCEVEPDGSCVVTGYAPELFMMKLDSNGTVLWCKNYYSGINTWHNSRGQQLERTIDGNYAVLANLQLTSGGRRPYLMKTDLNGDTLWTSAAGSNQPFSYLTSDLLATTDGGFMYDGVVSGDFPNQNSSMFYVYKTDSMGKLPCLSRWYPTTVGNLFPTPTPVSLTWATGATAYPAFFSDTTSSPMPKYDACVITNSISDPRRQRHQRIRPNPNNGQFAIEFTEPVQAQSFYSVYNSSGKLLFERTMQRGTTTEEINLNGFGKGLYLIKLTEGAVVRTERVVVE